MLHIAFIAVHLSIRGTLEKKGRRNVIFLGETLSIFFKKITSVRGGGGEEEKRGEEREG